MGTMSDISLKKLMLDSNSQAFEEYAATVSAFCVNNGLELDRGLELATEIIGDIIAEFVNSGGYKYGLEIVNIRREKEQKLLQQLREKMREDSNE